MAWCSFKVQECTIFRACCGKQLRRMFGTLAAVVIALGGVLVTEAAVPTHVLFFLIDDLGYADVGYHGNPVGSKVFTPTIDALSGDGVRLESYYGQCVRACVRLRVWWVVGCPCGCRCGRGWVWVYFWSDNDFGRFQFPRSHMHWVRAFEMGWRDDS